MRSFLTTGNSGMMGGCMLWLLRMLRYLAMFLEGSNTSCRSPNSFSYLLGNFSHELRRRATGAKFRPLRRGADKEDEKEQVSLFLHSSLCSRYFLSFLAGRHQPVHKVIDIICIDVIQQLENSTPSVTGVVMQQRAACVRTRCCQEPCKERHSCS